MTHIIYISYLYIHIHVPSASYPEASDLRVRHEVDTALALQSRGIIRSQETFGDGQMSDVCFCKEILEKPREVFMYIYIFLVRCKDVFFFGIKVDVFFLMVPFDQ